jgi:hypothetical protein
MEYRNLTGAINYLCNIKIYALYSRILKAFLDSNTNMNTSSKEESSLYDNILCQAPLGWHKITFTFGHLSTFYH